MQPYNRPGGQTFFVACRFSQSEVCRYIYTRTDLRIERNPSARSDILLPAVPVIFEIGKSTDVHVSELDTVIKVAVRALEEYEARLHITIVSTPGKGVTRTG